MWAKNGRGGVKKRARTPRMEVGKGVLGSERIGRVKEGKEG